MILSHLYVRSWQYFIAILCLYFLARSYKIYHTRTTVPCKITKKFETKPGVILPYLYVRSCHYILTRFVLQDCSRTTMLNIFKHHSQILTNYKHKSLALWYKTTSEAESQYSQQNYLIWYCHGLSWDVKRTGLGLGQGQGVGLGLWVVLRTSRESPWQSWTSLNCLRVTSMKTIFSMYCASSIIRTSLI